jgi:hypothetical protein
VHSPSLLCPAAQVSDQLSHNAFHLREREVCPASVARSAHSLHWTAWHACALRTAAAAHRGSKRAQSDTAVTAAVRVHHVSPRAKATAMTAVTDYYYPQEAIRCMAGLSSNSRA